MIIKHIHINYYETGYIIDIKEIIDQNIDMMSISHGNIYKYVESEYIKKQCTEDEQMRLENILSNKRIFKRTTCVEREQIITSVNRIIDKKLFDIILPFLENTHHTISILNPLTADTYYIYNTMISHIVHFDMWYSLFKFFYTNYENIFALENRTITRQMWDVMNANIDILHRIYRP
jgi:hypothetical protein